MAGQSETPNNDAVEQRGQPSVDPSEPDVGTTILFRRAAGAGDPEALEALVRRMEPMLISEVAAQMGGRLRKMFEVDDMTQSVLLSLIKDLRERKFEWRGSASLRANLIHRVINKIRQRARHQSAQKRNPGNLVSLQDSAVAAASEPAWEDRAWLEEEDELQAAVSELLTYYRAKTTTVKYILLSISGHSSAEIEQLLGVTSRRIRQIEEELREHVQKRWLEI